MGVVQRQSIKGALANYLGVFIGFFTTFFVITRLLTQEEIGLTRVMVDAAMLFSGLAQIGTNASIIRFYPYFKDPDRRDHGFFGWTLILPVIGFIIISAILLVFKGDIMGIYAQKSALLTQYYYLLLPLTFFVLYMTVFETNASVLLRITVPKTVREVLIRIFNLICYVLYGYRLIGFDTFVILFCGSYAVAMGINFFYLLSLGKISFRLDLSFVNRRMGREVILYTLFMTATILAGNIPLINTIFLGAQSGLELVGVYTIAFFIANVVEVPYRSLGAITQPLISQATKEDNIDEVNRLGKKVSALQLLVASLIFYFIWINLDALFAVIPNGQDYAAGTGVVFILGLAKVFNSSFSIGTNILNFSRKYMMALPFIAVLTLCAILFNIYLIPHWGLNGSASATLLSYSIYFGILLSYLHFKLKVNLFSLSQLKTVVLIVAFLALDQLWQLGFTATGIEPTKLILIANSAAKSLVLGFTLMALVYRWQISPDINDVVDKLLKKRK